MKLTQLPGMKEGSTIRNLLFGAVYVFVAFMVMGAMLGPAEDTESADGGEVESEPATDPAEETDTEAATDGGEAQATEADAEEPTETEAEQSSADGYQVRFVHEGEWTGNIGSLESSRSVDGSGTETFDIDEEDPLTVTAVGQKGGNGDAELTVQILKDGDVVAEQSTTAEYGTVSVSTND